MACAIFALGVDKEVTILNAEAVNKSFPDFYAYIDQLMHYA
jgi:5-enolpyruvylshikimate-3-phosphate synthase